MLIILSAILFLCLLTQTEQNEEENTSEITSVELITIDVEVQQPTSEFQNEDSRVTSHPAQQPPPLAILEEKENEGPNLKTELKVASLVIMISAGGIVSVLAGLPGNEKAELTHKVLFKAYTLLNYISLVSSVGLFLLTYKRPNFPILVMIIKFTTWVTLGSVIYALGCAACIILPKSLVVVVLVLVIPLVMVFVGIVIAFNSRRN